MNLLNVERAVVIASHPDDAELGCGATMALLADRGVDVTVLMLSDRGEANWFDEAKRAAACLMPPGQIRVETCHFTVFHMASERAAILRRFELYRDLEFEPDLIFAPAANDMHQDHRTALDEARRAFKGVSLLTYEIVRSNHDFRPAVFVPVTADYVDRKIRAVNCYATQRDKLYCQRGAIEGLARVRGAMCDVPFAEAFGLEWLVCDCHKKEA